MLKEHPLILAIPKSCSENWDEMTPVAQGRFCAHCQKSVIDFTGWSDAALYKFFEQNTGPVCGRLLHTQLNRSIQLPPQKPTLLYRIALAVGLTLVVAHTATETQARPRPPLSAYTFSDQDKEQNDNDTTTLVFNGLVLNEGGQPVADVLVAAREGGIFKGGAMTDHQGFYTIKVDNALRRKDAMILEFSNMDYVRQQIDGARDSSWQRVTLRKITGRQIMSVGLIVTPQRRLLHKTDLIDPKRFGY